MRPDDDLEEIESVPFSSLVELPIPRYPGRQMVVADTSPLSYLVQIECDFLLPLLYQRVITAPIVVAELTHAGAPPIVAAWANKPPAWLEVLPLATEPDEKLRLLDPGERDAIQLALDIGAFELLIDEFRGRREAQARGLSIIGTLGVLISGQRGQFVDGRPFIQEIDRTDQLSNHPRASPEFLRIFGIFTLKLSADHFAVLR